MAAIAVHYRSIPCAAPHTRCAPDVYRRRRAVAAVLFLGVLLAGSWALGALGGGSLTASGARSSAAPARLAVQPVNRTSFVVQPGDTLWTIARRLQPKGDVRPLVDALAESRGGRPLQVGERVSLP